MHSARVSMGKISLTVRYAELAPAEAKKKITALDRVSVTAVSEPKITPVMASKMPEIRCRRSSGPALRCRRAG